MKKGAFFPQNTGGLTPHSLSYKNCPRPSTNHGTLGFFLTGIVVRVGFSHARAQANPEKAPLPTNAYFPFIRPYYPSLIPVAALPFLPSPSPRLQHTVNYSIPRVSAYLNVSESFILIALLKASVIQRLENKKVSPDGETAAHNPRRWRYGPLTDDFLPPSSRVIRFATGFIRHYFSVLSFRLPKPRRAPSNKLNGPILAIETRRKRPLRWTIPPSLLAVYRHD